MKMKFLALCGLSMALCANCGTVFAQTGSQKIDAVYNDIKIVVASIVNDSTGLNDSININKG